MPHHLSLKAATLSLALFLSSISSSDNSIKTKHELEELRFNDIENTSNLITKQIELEKLLNNTNSDDATIFWNDLIIDSKKSIPKQTSFTKEEAISTLTKIDSIIDSKGFKYGQVMSISDGLKEKRLDCQNKTLIYYSLAKELDLPVSISIIPNHVFVRWILTDTSHINWEPSTSSINKIRTDEFYAKLKNIPCDFVANKIYLKSLNREQINDLVWERFFEQKNSQEKQIETEFFHYSKKNHDLKTFTEIAKNNRKIKNLNPLSAYNLGVDNLSTANYAKALILFDRAIELDPAFSLSWYNKGIALYYLSKLEHADSCITKAINLDKTKDSKNQKIQKNIYLITQRETIKKDLKLFLKTIYDKNYN
ncbi:MAG: tetratricopeptide repeat protein [Candidatus Nanoarchaeia archaeon]